ncbi:MAG: CDP-alcohol phosphatidyltransferase family protein [Hyphomicrobiaceae bacterium]
MLDAHIRPLINPPLNQAGRALARIGIGAIEMTLAGFVAGLSAAAAIAIGQPGWATVLILLSRLADGLDGAIARATHQTDRGGFLDITLDFIFYGAVPLAFAFADSFRNALPAAVLLLSFYANGSAFLAFAIIAEKRGLTSDAQGKKSLYYLTGLAEGTETIIFFVLCCLFPDAFRWLALLFAGLCFVSTAARIAVGWRTFT